jgi:hypothetical protein
MDIRQTRTGSIQEEMIVEIDIRQENVEAAIGSSQEEIRAAIGSIQARLEISMKHRVEDVLMSIDHRTHGTQAEIRGNKDPSRYHAERTRDQRIRSHRRFPRRV